MPTKLSEVSLDSLAEEFDYSKLAVHPNNDGRMCSYVRGHEKVHVYLKTGTVATCIDHPRHGKTQLFRRNLKWEEICDVFENPRTHTGKGYRRLASGEKYKTIQNIDYDFNRFDSEIMQHEYEEVLSNINENGDEIDSISIGDGGFFILLTSGEYHCDNIPNYLLEKLNSRGSNDPKPEIVVLGTHHPDSYFIQFADGRKSYRHLPEDLTDELENSNKCIDVIAFSREYYYLRFSDGEEHCHLPSKLKLRLEDKYEGEKIARISLARYSGKTAYAVTFASGRISKYMAGSTFRDTFDEAENVKNIQHIAIGGNGDFAIIC